MGDEWEDIVVISKTSSCCWHAKYTVFGQIYVLDPGTDLVAREVIVQATVVIDSEDTFVVLDFNMNRKWLVSEVSQTTALLLCDSISKRER